MSILVGTASWTDPTLLASRRFYPPHAADAAGRLRYYATQFPIAEIDSSYYALPTPDNAFLWAQRTPADFVFNIKAFRLFTGHPTPIKALDRDIARELGDWPEPSIFYDQMPGDLRDEIQRRFLIAVEPLRLAGKLGIVHCQFPSWIRHGPRGRNRVIECVQSFDGLACSIEFRHRSWFEGGARADTLALAREANLVHTIVDSPAGFDDTVPPVWETTNTELALVRLHGRNATAWGAKSTASSGRFNYEYSESELAELAEHIARVAARIARTHVILNTNYQDQGMRNARGLMRALDLPGVASV
jgi:uncharacterized protein YecE (DUF72 family)